MLERRLVSPPSPQSYSDNILKFCGVDYANNTRCVPQLRRKATRLRFRQLSVFLHRTSDEGYMEYVHAMTFSL